MSQVCVTVRDTRVDPHECSYRGYTWPDALAKISDCASVLWDRDMRDVQFPDDGESPHVFIHRGYVSNVHKGRRYLASVYWTIAPSGLVWLNRASFVRVSFDRDPVSAHRWLVSPFAENNPVIRVR